MLKFSYAKSYGIHVPAAIFFSYGELLIIIKKTVFRKY